ncbi:hypothetical protein GGQ99_005127 [Aminobacter niigataensis]|uniref:Uncharacterized protein n=1 Tax=Aminobacter niigataensis TaxID=83265 RepID=A0ABR6L942_9HYPH|nr:hypothetical protein [Aminobacter niigataensis]MBB4653337.1 hypothetical protein [Aminobacter niigataensis]
MAGSGFLAEEACDALLLRDDAQCGRNDRFGDLYLIARPFRAAGSFSEVDGRLSLRQVNERPQSLMISV